MSIERTYYCDNPSCADDKPGDCDTPCHARTITPPPHLPSGFIEARTRESGADDTHHFCSWDCLMKFAASMPVPEIITLD